MTLFELLEAQARSHESLPALLAPGRPPLTYGALLTQVDGAGAALAALGLGRGSRVALALPNGAELAVAIVSTMSWSTCAPLNPAYDQDTCRYLLAKMRAAVLVVGEAANPPAVLAARSLRIPIVRLSFTRDEPAGTFRLSADISRNATMLERTGPDDCVLLLHTSGTTAKPKLVPLPQRSQVEAFLSRAEFLRLGPEDRCLCVAPLFTASGIKRNIGPALVAGASVVCVPGFDVDKFFNWLEMFRPTYYTGPPTVHRAVLAALEQRRDKLQHSLRYVLATSASLPEEEQERLERKLGVPVLQAYAMTEGGSIAHDPLPPARRRSGSVGFPVDCDVRVLGAPGTFLPPGEVGEFVVRSRDMFAGYEDDPEANAAAFHEGWFRTGDLGYLDEDGYLYVVGRIKELVNRGGLKVSPTAVDAVLMQHPNVIEAAAFGVPHPTLGEDLVAAIVPRADASVSEQELRDFLLRRLAGHMVPSRILVEAQLPKSALGKVQRSALAERFEANRRPPFTAPRDACEELVAGFFSQALAGTRVGALDNFFDLGGDSLSGAQVVSGVNLALGANLAIESLFRRPTVAEFAAELNAAARSGAGSGPPPIRPRRKVAATLVSASRRTRS